MELLPIYEVFDADLGGRMGWYTKGHVDKEEFLFAALELQIFECDGIVPACSTEEVKYDRWRIVPLPGSPSGGRFVKGEGRGSFEVTAIEWAGGGWGTHICMISDCNEPAQMRMVPGSLPFGSIYLRLCSAHMVDYEASKRARALDLSGLVQDVNAGRMSPLDALGQIEAALDMAGNTPISKVQRT